MPVEPTINPTIPQIIAIVAPLRAPSFKAKIISLKESLVLLRKVDTIKTDAIPTKAANNGL